MGRETADVAGGVELLRCSGQWALKLTKDARAARDQATKSIALALAARGLTQRQIANKLSVDHRTVGRRLGQFAPRADDAP